MSHNNVTNTSQIPINSIICGKSEKILSTWPSSCIDLISCSPPYDNIRSSKDYSDVYNFKKIAYEMSRVLNVGGTICWNEFSQYIDGGSTCSHMKHLLYFVEDLGLKLIDTIIYAKNSFAHPSSNRYHQTHEYVYILSKGKQKTFNPIFDRPNKYLGRRGASGRKKDGTRNTGHSEVNNVMGKRFNVWEYKIGKGHTTKDNIAYGHPALQPESLSKDLIISYSNKHDVVLDPFNGAGTTTKAAHLLNRKYIGIDRNKEYCKIAEQRLKI